jgi:hypothetical protein
MILIILQKAAIPAGSTIKAVRTPRDNAIDRPPAGARLFASYGLERHLLPAARPVRQKIWPFHKKPFARPPSRGEMVR